MKKLFVVLALFLLMVTVFAVQPKDVLQARYDKMNCYATLALDYASALTSNKVDQTASVKSDVNLIKTNRTLLANYIKNSDANDLFDAKMKEIYTNITELNGKVFDVVKDYKEKDEDTVKKNLKSKLNSLKSTFNTCKKLPQVTLIQSRINLYKKDVSVWNTRIASYKKQGIDTNEMSLIISNANKLVVTPLEKARDTLDANKIQIALLSYCLYEGCDTNNYHFTEKMEVARFRTLLSKLKNEVFSTQLPIQWVNANKALDSAEKILVQTGVSKFDSNSKQEFYNNLGTVSENLKTVYVVLGSVKK